MTETTQYRTSPGQDLATRIALHILQSPYPTYARYDVTARFAHYMMQKLQKAIMSPKCSAKEEARLRKHIARYEDILERHITYA